MIRNHALIRIIILFILFGFSSVLYAEKPVREVGIEVYIDNVDALLPREGTAEVDLTLHLRWQTNDTANKTRYYTDTSVNPMLQKIDFPYYKIQNLRSKIEPTRESLTIAPDGRADYLADMTLSIETEMDMHLFPFDGHTLNINISPYGESPYEDHYYFLSKKPGYSSMVNLDEWSMNVRPCQISSENNLTTYHYNIEFQRKFGYYVHRILLPLLIILAISYGLLWLPPESPIGLISLLTTLLLMVVAFQWVVAQDLPSVSYMTIFQAILLLVYCSISTEIIFVILGEKLNPKNKSKLHYFSKWFYPVFFLLGISAIIFFR